MRANGLEKPDQSNFSYINFKEYYFNSSVFGELAEHTESKN